MRILPRGKPDILLCALIPILSRLYEKREAEMISAPDELPGVDDEEIDLAIIFIASLLLLLTKCIQPGAFQSATLLDNGDFEGDFSRVRRRGSRVTLPSPGRPGI